VTLHRDNRIAGTL